MRRVLLALWACLVCTGILMTPKMGLAQPMTQVSMRTVTDDAEHHFFDYWMMANEGYLLPETPRRLSLAQMENPLRWVRPGSEELLTSPAEILCANADARSLWLTCKQRDGSRQLAPFRSRCGGSPTIPSLLGGRACERPSIFTIERRPVLIERRYHLAREAPAAMPPTAPPSPVVDTPVARVEQPSTRAQAPPMAVVPREVKWPANALLLLAFAAFVMVVLVGVIMRLYREKQIAEEGKRLADETILAMQESARRRTAQTRATLLDVHNAREADRERVRTKIAPVTLGLAARLKALEEKHAQAESHRDKLLGEVHTLNAQIRRLEQENAALREQAQPTAIVGDSEEVARLRHALADAEARLAVLTGQVEEFESWKTRDDSTLAETLQRLSDVETDRDIAREEVDRLRAALEVATLEAERLREPTQELHRVGPRSDPPGPHSLGLPAPQEPLPYGEAAGSEDRARHHETLRGVAATDIDPVRMPPPGRVPQGDGFLDFTKADPNELTAAAPVPMVRLPKPPPGTVENPPANEPFSASGIRKNPATGS